MLGVATNLEEWAHEEYFVTSAGDPVVLVNPTGAAARPRRGRSSTSSRFIGADAVSWSATRPPARGGRGVAPAGARSRGGAVTR